MRYYSENWHEATEKFYKSAVKFGDLKWCVADSCRFDIPYVLIGHGPCKVVINSGVHGLEGYFGSAAQLMFLKKFAPFLSGDILKNYTIVLVHVINGWGMENRMREVLDPRTGALIDLNRNFGIDFSRPAALPANPQYGLSHDLLVSAPDPVAKKNAIKEFRRAHLKDGAWDAISHGQYTHPDGLFYGGNAPAVENRMTMHIYDQVMDADAPSLMSIGLHTGLGKFNRAAGRATAQLLVSHPALHKNTLEFGKIMGDSIDVVHDDATAAGPTLLGDLVDCLETRYADRNIPVYTADFEIGTGEFPIMSPIYKRMDMGDARYDLRTRGRINDQTLRNLTESWYPSDPGWRRSALDGASLLFHKLIGNMEKSR